MIMESCLTVGTDGVIHPDAAHAGVVGHGDAQVATALRGIDDNRARRQHALRLELTCHARGAR